MIVALTGLAGSGKSTAASFLEKEKGFARVSFAAPLKAMMRALLASQGVPEQAIERMISGDLKEQPTVALSGRSPRHAMQTLGTEWGREQMAATFWTDAAEHRISNLLRDGRSVVVDDCRFPNEAALVHRLGGFVVSVRRPGVVGAGSHVSEGGVECDRMLWNDGGVGILRERILGIVESRWAIGKVPTYAAAADVMVGA
jgi:predicted kinase